MTCELHHLISGFAILFLLCSVSNCTHPHGFTTYLIERDAPASCDPLSKYSRVDGHCNNLKNTVWGSQNQPYGRLADGTPLRPRLTDSEGAPLPSARKVTLTYHGPSKADSDVTLMHMQFGLFLCHDMTFAAGAETEANCTLCNSTDSNCMPISLDNDEYFTDKQCLTFIRHKQIPTSDSDSTENVNVNTAYIDLSTVYGSSDEQLEKLRLDNGFLKTKSAPNGGEYLPEDLPEGNKTSCKAIEEGEYCFLSGDNRVNVQPGLSALHTIFMREHNRIAARLTSLNPHWSGNKLFQETRRILIGIMQHITYAEYLPPLVGPIHMTDYGLASETYIYKEYLSPNIINSFATAAFRFGHSQIPDVYHLRNTTINFEDLYGRTIYNMDNMTDTMNMSKRDASPKTDRHCSYSVTRHLFTTGTPQSGTDLVSLSIQRERDHGLPSYNEFRHTACGLPKVKSFSEIFPDIPISSNAYKSVDDVDLSTGAMSEKPLKGALLGPTFACIISEQFRRQKFGDRFYYENPEGPGKFTSAQIQEIRKMTLAKVICENTGSKNIQKDVFHHANSDTNPMEPCSNIQDMDFTQWREENTKTEL